MNKPPAIKPGDTIGIVSPASSIEESKLENGVRLLEERGYKIRIGKHAFEKDGFLAGPDEHRAADLHDAWFDPEVKAVICSRGGYGASRILPMLALDKMAKSPKLFVGFSDVTALHLALSRRGLVTLHAPMLLSFVQERPQGVAQMWFSAMEGTAPIELPNEAPKAETLVGGTVEGVVTGGCLCLLTDSIGTPDEIDTEGKILLIEDVDEAPHRVDAMLTHLLNCGILQKAAGIIVGEMTRSDDKIDDGIGGKPWREIVRERIEKLNVPSVMNFPFGHQQYMASLPLGIRARLNAGQGELKYLELGVEA